MVENMILALPEERVKLLKEGLTGKQIEKVFVVLNNYKVVDGYIEDIKNLRDEINRSPKCAD